MFNSYNHWRNTARPPRFMSLDYRAGIFLILFMMHMRLWTFVLMILVFLILFFLERRGLTLPLAMRRLRVWVSGPIRPALARVHKRDMWDHGGS